MIIADRTARTPAGLACLVDLAEALQCSVVDQAGRMNFPTRHPLNQSDRARAAIADADVILGLDVADFYGITHTYRDQIERTSRAGTKPNAKLITISADDLYIKANYQDFQRYTEVDLAIAADSRSDAAFVDRSGQAPHHRRPQTRLSGSRRAAQGGAHAGARAVARRGGFCLGREPDQHGAHVHGAVGADSE